MTYGLLSVLGPSFPKLVFRPQIPRLLRYFLKFDVFIRFKLDFGCFLCENESWGSGFTAEAY